MPKKRVTITEVYQFNELSDRAKERAREWYREGALDYDWWENVYEDAERVGLKITGFDLGRAQECEGRLIMSIAESIQAILKDHGKDCDTYKLAMEYKPQIQVLRQRELESEENLRDELAELTGEYTYALREEYRHMLRQEYEYLLSDECVDEALRANEYEFLEDGTRA